MSNMKGISVVVPVHEYNEVVETLLKRCLTSIKDMAQNGKAYGVETELIVVGPESVVDKDLESLITYQEEETSPFTKVVALKNTGETNFCSQVNLAVEKSVAYDYFMIVELDDAVTPKYLKSVSYYTDKRPNTTVFLPLVELYELQNLASPVGYMNEIAWSNSFSDEELGSLNLDALNTYYNFNVTGGVFKTADFKKAGSLKPSIKVSFAYELLLRMANLYGEVYIIPKVGYFHTVNRKDSLTDIYQQTVSQEEGSWWIKLAGQEYLFKKDRNKEYTPDEE